MSVYVVACVDRHVLVRAEKFHDVDVTTRGRHMQQRVLILSTTTDISLTHSDGIEIVGQMFK